MAKKLTETHPLSVKFGKLEKFLMEHTLEIDVNGYGRMWVKDVESNVCVWYQDIEDNDQSILPSIYEVKLKLLRNDERI